MLSMLVIYLHNIMHIICPRLNYIYKPQADNLSENVFKLKSFFLCAYKEFDVTGFISLTQTDADFFYFLRNYNFMHI